MSQADEERDYDAFKEYIDLWKSENVIKTNKLQALLLTNALLASAAVIAGGFKHENALLFLAGFILSFIWVLSIGRTILFQKVWQLKITKIASKKEYADDPRFRVLDTVAEEREAPAYLRTLGGVSSKFYLMGAPLLFSLFWLAVLLYV